MMNKYYFFNYDNHKEMVILANSDDEAWQLAGVSLGTEGWGWDMADDPSAFNFARLERKND